MLRAPLSFLLQVTKLDSESVECIQRRLSGTDQQEERLWSEVCWPGNNVDPMI